MVTSDFFQEVMAKYDERASGLAPCFAAVAKGKTIRNVDQALVAFNNYKNSLGVNFGAQDRNAIHSTLKSMDYANMAKQLSACNKVFGCYGEFYDLYDITHELIKSLDTEDRRLLFVKIETFTAGKVATAVTAFAFSILAGVPPGIVGFAVIMSTVGTLVDDNLINKINANLGIYFYQIMPSLSRPFGRLRICRLC